MAPLSHVQPGDLITSQLLNDIIDALTALDEKITKCCEDRTEPEPAPDGKGKKVDIIEVDPAKAGYLTMVDIHGEGFIPDAKGNIVIIGDEKVQHFGRVTETLIQAEVPLHKFKKMNPVAVRVENKHGFDEHKFEIGPKTDPDVPFVPTSDKVVEAMLKLAKVDKRDLVYDLGCGDGRLVIKAAKAPFHARGVGIDIDPERVKEARDNVKIAGVEKFVEIKQGDLFGEDLGKATVVAIYLTTGMNARLEARFKKLTKGTRIVSHRFELPVIKHAAHTVVDGEDIYLYRM